MSYIDELKQQGATELGDSQGAATDNGTSNFTTAPFVKWPADGHAFIHGKVVDIWEKDYGPNVELEVFKTSDNLTDKNNVKIEPGSRCNVSMNFATMKDNNDKPLVKDEHRDEYVYFEFLGKRASAKNPQRQYSLFQVLKTPPPKEAPKPTSNEAVIKALDLAPVTDDLPF
mgnify:CR=1 FL=1